jgi:hypothetical protein
MECAVGSGQSGVRCSRRFSPFLPREVRPGELGVAPRFHPMRSALADLQLNRLDVIHAGQETFPLDRHVRAVAASRVPEDLVR